MGSNSVNPHLSPKKHQCLRAEEGDVPAEAREAAYPSSAFCSIEGHSGLDDAHLFGEGDLLYSVYQLMC